MATLNTDTLTEVLRVPALGAVSITLTNSVAAITALVVEGRRDPTGPWETIASDAADYRNLSEPLFFCSPINPYQLGASGVARLRLDATRFYDVRVRAAGDGSVLIGTATIDGAPVQVLNVATGSSLPLAKAVPVTGNSATPMTIRLPVQGGLQVVIPNWFATLGIEAGPGAACDVRASIEYPVGVRTPFTFNGALQGSIPNFADIVSDILDIAIPEGTTVLVRIWRNCSSGVVYTGYSNNIPPVPNGTLFEVGAALVDKTLVGDAPAATVNIFSPAALISATAGRSVASLGDSTAYGSTDNKDIGILRGWIARSVGKLAPFMDCAYPSNQVTTMQADNNVKAISLVNRYSSDCIVQIGTNDLAGGVTVANILSRLATVLGKISVARRWASTLFPRTTTKAYTVSAATSASTTATLAMADTSGQVVGGPIVVSGLTPAAYNGTYTITAITPNVSVSYAFGGGTSPATGTAAVSDGWGSEANQTVLGTEAQRVSLNTTLRAGIALTDGTFDPATAIETSMNSGKFAVEPGTVPNNTTEDGVHAVGRGYRRIERAAVIPASLFTKSL